MSRAWKEDRARLERLAVIDALEHSKSIVFLDGLDELDAALRRRVEEDISFLALRLDHARLFVTCRTGAFAQHVDGSAEYELVDLSRDQMETLVRQSLGAGAVEHFFQLLDARPYAGTMRRPLLLQNLCLIYRRDQTLPAKATDVYQRVVTLLIKEWDEKRQVTRLSKWPGFDASRKRPFLAELAYRLTMRGHNAVFTERDLTLAFAKVRERFRMLPPDSCLDIAAELEEDTGLIVGSSNGTFEFFHKSIQEFLCAEHILALTHKPYSRDELLGIPNELSIFVSLTADPGSRLAEIDRTIRDQSLGFVFYHTFVTRLILEDCDFEPSESTGCALLNLYSGLLASATSHTHFQELYSTGAALTLQRMIGERISMQVVVDAYRLSKTTDRVGDDPVVLLRRRDRGWIPQADATRALVQYELRETLHVLASALPAVDGRQH